MKESPWTCGLEKYWGNVIMLPYIGTEFAANWPDRYIASLAWSGWVEFKNPKTVLKDAQWVNIRRLQQFGTMACVVRREAVARDYHKEMVRIHITHRVRYDAIVKVSELLYTLNEMFYKIRETTHNYLAPHGFFC